MDRVIAFNIVLDHIHDRANAAAGFLSRKQTDRSQSLELQLLDSIRMKQIVTDMKAKTPDASMRSIESSSILHGSKQLQIPQDLMEQLQANGALQSLFPNLNQIPESGSPKETMEICPKESA